MNFPKITIVTPSYNQGQYIEETIRSVIDQNYPNLEYMIIDGGSTDNTVEIIKKYEKHITYWVSEKDKGQSDAINKGLARATGDIFNWLNSDDYYTTGTLLKVAESFTDASVEVVNGRSNIFSEKRSIIGERSFGFDVEKNITTLSRINQPATFFRMKIIRELGELSTQLHYCMDLEWWMKYLFTHGHKSILNTDQVFVNFREHEASKTIGQYDSFIEDYFALYSGILAKKATQIRAIDNYVFDCDLTNVPRDFVFRLTNCLFYYYLVIYYGKREMKKVRKILPFVMAEQLLPEQKLIYDRIKFRSNFFLSWLHSFSGIKK